MSKKDEFSHLEANAIISYEKAFREVAYKAVQPIVEKYFGEVNSGTMAHEMVDFLANKYRQRLNGRAVDDLVERFNYLAKLVPMAMKYSDEHEEQDMPQ